MLWNHSATKICDFVGRHGNMATLIGGIIVFAGTTFFTGSALAGAIVAGIGYLAIAKMVTEKVPDPYNNMFVRDSRCVRNGHILTGVLFVPDGEQRIAYQRELFVSTEQVNSEKKLKRAVEKLEQEPRETSRQAPPVILSVTAKGPYWWAIRTWLRPKVVKITKVSATTPDQVTAYNSGLEKHGPPRKGAVNRTGAFAQALVPG